MPSMAPPLGRYPTVPAAALGVPATPGLFVPNYAAMGTAIGQLTAAQRGLGMALQLNQGSHDYYAQNEAARREDEAKMRAVRAGYDHMMAEDANRRAAQREREQFQGGQALQRLASQNDALGRRLDASERRTQETIAGSDARLTRRLDSTDAAAQARRDAQASKPMSPAAQVQAAQLNRQGEESAYEVSKRLMAEQAGALGDDEAVRLAGQTQDEVAGPPGSAPKEFPGAGFSLDPALRSIIWNKQYAAAADTARKNEAAAYRRLQDSIKNGRADRAEADRSAYRDATLARLGAEADAKGEHFDREQTARALEEVDRNDRAQQAFSQTPWTPGQRAAALKQQLDLIRKGGDADVPHPLLPGGATPGMGGPGGGGDEGVAGGGPLIPDLDDLAPARAPARAAPRSPTMDALGRVGATPSQGMPADVDDLAGAVTDPYMPQARPGRPDSIDAAVHDDGPQAVQESLARSRLGVAPDGTDTSKFREEHPDLFGDGPESQGGGLSLPYASSGGVEEFGAPLPAGPAFAEDDQGNRSESDYAADGTRLAIRLLSKKTPEARAIALAQIHANPDEASARGIDSEALAATFPEHPLNQEAE